MEEWCDQAALRVVDFMPAVPLYVVKSMSEAEREEMIKDKLPDRVPLSVMAYQKALDEGRSAAADAELQSIAQDTIATSLELVEEGSLPDIHTNRMQRTRLLERSSKITTAVAGNAPSKGFFSKALNKIPKAGGHGAVARGKASFGTWMLESLQVSRARAVPQVPPLLVM